MGSGNGSCARDTKTLRLGGDIHHRRTYAWLRKDPPAADRLRLFWHEFEEAEPADHPKKATTAPETWVGLVELGSE